MTTARFAADQLIINVRYTTTCATLCHFLCFGFTLASSCDIGEPGMGSPPLSFLGSQPIAMLLVSVYLTFFISFDCCLLLSICFSFRCVLRPLPFHLYLCLGCIPPLIGLPSLRFHAVASSLFLLFVCVCLCFLFYRDDVLCWLLSCPFSSVCFPGLPPIPGLIWFGSVYLVTTAGFEADQLM